MKNIAILISLVAFILSLASCGGPEADQKKLFKKYKEFTEVANNASEDSKLDEDEIEEINQLINEMNEFKDEMDEKYKEDSVSQKIITDYFEANKNDVSEIYENFFDAWMKLYACEGADKLQ